MFIRAKTIKGKKYAYLVENSWVKGKVKQKVKKYLGKIIPLPALESVQEIVLEGSKEEQIKQIIIHDLISRGCTQEKNTLQYDSVTINTKTGAIIEDNKPAVLMINKRYFSKDTFKELLTYYEPESTTDTPGKKLAMAFRQAGIVIHPKNFVQLYKFLMSLDSHHEKADDENDNKR